MSYASPDFVAWYTPVGCFNDAHATIVRIENGCYHAYRIDVNREDPVSSPKVNRACSTCDRDIVEAFRIAQRALLAAIEESGPLRRINGDTSSESIVFVGTHPAAFAIRDETSVIDAAESWSVFHHDETKAWPPDVIAESSRDWALVFARSSKVGRVDFISELLRYIHACAGRVAESTREEPPVSMPLSAPSASPR